MISFVLSMSSFISVRVKVIQKDSSHPSVVRIRYQKLISMVCGTNSNIRSRRGVQILGIEDHLVEASDQKLRFLFKMTTKKPHSTLWRLLVSHIKYLKLVDEVSENLS